MVKSYRSHFLLHSDNEGCYIKSTYEYRNFCNSRFSSANENMMIRLQNTMASALNKCEHLPKYVLVILDDDIITFTEYLGPGVSSLLGSYITWIVKEFRKLVEDKKNALPAKVKQPQEPCIYFCASPMHQNLSYEQNDLCKKFFRSVVQKLTSN